MPPGSLVVVGHGITGGQVTSQAEVEIRIADIVLSLTSDPVAKAFVVHWAREYVDVSDAYQEGRGRPVIYADIANRVLEPVRAGRRVCFVTYGHPGVLSAITRMAIRQARAEGFPARMLPGISAEACLYADLGVDPGEEGIQSYQATQLLCNEKIWDPTTPLILWQIGLVGDDAHHANYPNSLLSRLVEKLVAVYGPNHEAVIYEAATLPYVPFRADRVALAELPRAELSACSTLLVEPLTTNPADPDATRGG